MSDWHDLFSIQTKDNFKVTDIIGFPFRQDDVKVTTGTIKQYKQ